MHKSACQSDCVATARPSCPLGPPKQPRRASRAPRGQETARARRFVSFPTDPSDLFAFCSPPCQANRNLAVCSDYREICAHRHAPSPPTRSRSVSSRRVASRLPTFSRPVRPGRVRVHENERQARSTNHTFVGITPSYMRRRSRGRRAVPLHTPFIPRSYPLAAPTIRRLPLCNSYGRGWFAYTRARSRQTRELRKGARERA